MPDINELIEKLDKLIISNSNQDFIPWSTDRDYGILRMDISIRTRMFHGFEDRLQNNFLPIRFDGIEPLIDVIETGNFIRVIVTLSRIKKEDVWYDMKKDILEIEINKNGRIFKKEIHCASKLRKSMVKSTALNNSVLEITFAKIGDN
jgi:HSP20 family molecular chaperone IbpA